MLRGVFLLLFIFSIALHSSELTERQDLVVAEKEYNSFHYILLKDNSVWAINPDELISYKEIASSTKVEILPSHVYHYPYWIYSSATGDTASIALLEPKDVTELLMPEEKAGHEPAGDLNDWMTHYTITEVEDVGRGLIELNTGFYWSVEEIDAYHIWEWKPGDRALITKISRDTGTRYAEEGYKIINIDKNNEEVLVAQFFS